MTADIFTNADEEPISLLQLYQDFGSVAAWAAIKPVKKFGPRERQWTGRLSNTKIDATAPPAFTLGLLPGSNGNEIYFNKGNDKINLTGSGNSVFMGAGQNEANVAGSNNTIRSGDFSNSKAIVRSRTTVSGNSNQVFLSASGETTTVNGIGNRIKGEGKQHIINVSGGATYNTNDYNALLSISGSTINVKSAFSRIAIEGTQNNILIGPNLAYYGNIMTFDGRGNFRGINTINYDGEHELALYNGNFEILRGANARNNANRVSLYYTSEAFQKKGNSSTIRFDDAKVDSYGHNVQILASYCKVNALPINSSKTGQAEYSFTGIDNKIDISSQVGRISFIDGFNADLTVTPHFYLYGQDQKQWNWGTIDFSKRGSQTVRFLLKSTASYSYNNDGSLTVRDVNNIVFRTTGMERNVDRIFLNNVQIFS